MAQEIGIIPEDENYINPFRLKQQEVHGKLIIDDQYSIGEEVLLFLSN